MFSCDKIVDTCHLSLYHKKNKNIYDTLSCYIKNTRYVDHVKLSFESAVGRVHVKLPVIPLCKANVSVCNLLAVYQ